MPDTLREISVLRGTYQHRMAPSSGKTGEFLDLFSDAKLLPVQFFQHFTWLYRCVKLSCYPTDFLLGRMAIAYVEHAKCEEPP